MNPLSLFIDKSKLKLRQRYILINKDIIEAFSMLAKEKNIDRTNLSTIIEDIFMALIHKKYGEERENFSVIVNMEKGEIEIYQEMTVVSTVIDPVTEIHIDEATKEYDDLEVGDAYVIDLGKGSMSAPITRTITINADLKEYHIPLTESIEYKSAEKKRKELEGLTVKELIELLSAIPGDTKVTRGLYGTAIPIRPSDLMLVINVRLTKDGEEDRYEKPKSVHNNVGWTVCDRDVTLHIAHPDKILKK